MRIGLCIACCFALATQAFAEPFTITIRTSDKRHAATNARAFIILNNGDVQSEKINLEGGDFDRGGTDVFNVEADNVHSPLSSVQLGQDNSGRGPSWHVQDVKVFNPTSGLTQTFPLNDWIKGDNPQGIRIEEDANDLRERVNAGSAAKFEQLETQLEDRLADVTASLEARLAALEGHHEDDVAIESRLAALEGHHEDDVAIESRLAALERHHEDDVAIESRLAALEGHHEDDVAVEAKLTENTERLDALEDQLQSLRDQCSCKDGDNEFILAFRGQAGIGTEVYPAYISGAGIPDTVEPGCKQVSDLSLPCNSHYRNNQILDNWDNVAEVKVVLFENGAEVREIVFDGTDTDYLTWFSPSKVKSSTWSDLKGETTNYFSIQGHERADLQRRFFINQSYGGCPSDSGWLVAIDMTSGPCPWERVPSIPSFKYSKKDSYTNWNNASDVGHADTMAILVKYA